MRSTTHLFSFTWFIVLSLLLLTGPLQAETEAVEDTKKTIVASATGYTLPGNTLASLAIGALEKADMIELDLVATSDNRILALQGIDLTQYTDVADLFPGGADGSGNYLVPDFSFSEIRQLRRKDKTAPQSNTTFQPAIPTLEDCLTLLQALEQKQDRKISLAINIILPAMHRTKGIDLSRNILQTLHQFGYGRGADDIVLISMDGDELQRIKKELLPMLMLDIPLYQRIGGQPADTSPSLPAYDQSWMFTRIGTRLLGSYASGVVLHHSLLHDSKGNPLNELFLENLKALEMDLFVFEVSGKQETMPQFAATYEELLDYYFETLAVDGVITDSVVKSINIIRGPEPASEVKPLFPLQPYMN